MSPTLRVLWVASAGTYAAGMVACSLGHIWGVWIIFAYMGFGLAASTATMREIVYRDDDIIV